MRNCTFTVILLFITSMTYGQLFTEIGAAAGVNHGGNKDGGVAWADLNNDGCLDLIFNTTDNAGGMRSRMYFSDCALPTPTFTDVTVANANGLNLQELDKVIFYIKKYYNK